MWVIRGGQWWWKEMGMSPCLLFGQHIITVGKMNKSIYSHCILRHFNGKELEREKRDGYASISLINKG